MRNEKGFLLVEMLVVLLLVALVAAYVGTNMVAAMQLKHETYAAGVLKSLAVAEQTYASYNGGGYATTTTTIPYLSACKATNPNVPDNQHICGISPVIMNSGTTGSSNGYTFSITAITTPTTGVLLQAVPNNSASGRKVFCSVVPPTPSAVRFAIGLTAPGTAAICNGSTFSTVDATVVQGTKGTDGVNGSAGATGATGANGADAPPCQGTGGLGGHGGNGGGSGSSGSSGGGTGGSGGNSNSGETSGQPGTAPCAGRGGDGGFGGSGGNGGNGGFDGLTGPQGPAGVGVAAVATAASSGFVQLWYVNNTQANTWIVPSPVITTINLPSAGKYAVTGYAAVLPVSNGEIDCYLIDGNNSTITSGRAQAVSLGSGNNINLSAIQTYASAISINLVCSGSGNLQASPGIQGSVQSATLTALLVQ